MTDDTTSTIDLGTTADGLPVVATDLELRGVGGGLSKPLRVDPQLFQQGQRVIVSYEAVVRSHRFDPTDKEEPDGDQARVHIAYAEVAIVRPATGKGQLEGELKKMREQIKRADEADQGIQRLPTDDELQSAHDAGEHAGALLEGCPECDKEAAAEAAGN